MNGLRLALSVAAVVLALPGAFAALHLTVLSIASLWYRESDVLEDLSQLRFLVLIPACNEEVVIGRTLDAILADVRARDQVLVVADHCTDATAAIARSHGVGVLERSADSAPGRHEARQAGLDHARALSWDAVVMIDADSVIESGFFDACERRLCGGASAVQARSEAAPRRGVVGQASLAAFTLQGVTLPRGRDRLGLAVRLRGTGMALRRELLTTRRFRAPASEDLFFGLDLCLDGIRPRHADTARLRSESVGSWSAASGQRLRYEAGRLAAAKEFLGPLLARRDPASLEAAWYLATPPFAVAVGSLLAGAVLASLAASWGLAVACGALLAALALDLVIGLVQARAGLRTWCSLLAAPWYVLWKVALQFRALARVRRDDDYYGPTARVPDTRVATPRDSSGRRE